MSIQELIEAAKNVKVTDEEIGALKKRLAEAEKQFEEDARRRRPDAAWYNRSYTI